MAPSDLPHDEVAAVAPVVPTNTPIDWEVVRANKLASHQNHNQPRRQFLLVTAIIVIVALVGGLGFAFGRSNSKSDPINDGGQTSELPTAVIDEQESPTGRASSVPYYQMPEWADPAPIIDGRPNPGVVLNDPLSYLNYWFAQLDAVIQSGNTDDLDELIVMNDEFYDEIFEKMVNGEAWEPVTDLTYYGTAGGSPNNTVTVAAGYFQGVGKWHQDTLHFIASKRDPNRWIMITDIMIIPDDY
jgi:hypothetical protein